jgi:fumarate reductase subunit C
VNKLDPETKADFLVLVIVTVATVLGLLFWQVVFFAVQPQAEPVKIMRDQFGHRKMENEK